MGEVYARRLIAAKIPVTGFDIDPARREPAKQISTIASSLRKCAAVAPIKAAMGED
jgi:3-hydroxyisobutyrate dehydrogenase-like beta-hydroxyacid dehydrogenase